MAVHFNIPKSPQLHTYVASRFLGANFTSEASTVDDTKSPNVENMIRSVPGKIRKRMGYYEVGDFKAPIYGVHHMSTSGTWLIHAGKKLYDYTMPAGKYWVDDNGNKVVDEAKNKIVLITGDIDDQLVYEGMAEHRSVSFQLAQSLVILDGESVKIYDGKTVKKITEVAYIPTISISKNPTGGGTDFEPINLLQPAFRDQFIVESKSTQGGYNPANIKSFQLTFGSLDPAEVKAWVLNADGNWIQKKEGTDFSVDRTLGKVTFLQAPGATPVSGEDNVKIEASRTVAGYADRINHCTIGAMFGVNGANDRLFVSGNEDHGVGVNGEMFSYINYDWFSAQYDPTYFADTNYSKLGSDASAIMGYSIINNYLAAHKDASESAQSILIREGDMVNSKPSFKLINTVQGAGAISRYCFGYLATEPVFLTSLGVYAVTAQDVTGEKYAQDRSYYLEGKLLKEPRLKDAFGYAWKDYFFLCINDHCYVLDGLQPMRTDNSRPYATRQYAGFYFTNIPANVMFEIETDLYFGSTNGKVYKFYSDDKNMLSYNDDGAPIKAVWETADISEDFFYKDKSYRFLSLRCMPEIASSVQVQAQRQGLWQVIKEDVSTLKYFSFQYFTFSKFTFSNNRTQKLASTKVRLKKLDHVRFRFVNDKLNEALGINDFAIEYTQSGNHKGD